MNYRPEGWDAESIVINLYQEVLTTESTDEKERKLVEAGADAMLEALRKEGTHLVGDTIIPAQGKFPEIHCPGGTMGWLIFIPDEEGDDAV